MDQQHPIGQRAVVIGGGMAGLTAARVLAERYAGVTIVERDALSAAAEPRKGVPQGRHAHALLARGQQALEELFPGLTQDLIAHGAPRGSGRFFVGGGFLSQDRQAPGGVFVSRPRLEAEVRARVSALPNVRIVDRCSAKGIVANADRTRVTGVRLLRSGAPEEEALAADLVVDASGRGSQAPAWLKTLGYPEPEVELVDVGMGYSTRIYRRDPCHLAGDVSLVVSPNLANRRACGMLAQEGDRWIVTLAGYFGDYPPTDDAGFLDFAQKMPTTNVLEVIRAATPLGDPVSYRFPANRRVHYERLGQFPDGFLVVGDGICSFTPIYGQGMTVAALEALALRDCLQTDPGQLARRFFKRASKTVDPVWAITVGNDTRLSATPGARGPMARCLDWYMDRLHAAARLDPRLATAFLRVVNLIDAPATLLHPRVAFRVARGNLLRPPAAVAEMPVASLAPVEG